MSIPNRIREDARLADERLRELANQSAAPVDGEPTVDPIPLDSRPPGDAPHPNAIPDPVQVTPPSDAITAEKYAELLQKFDTLQGIHNKAASKLSASETRLETLERIIGAQQAARAAEPAPAPTPTPRAALVTNEEVEEFGADLIDVVRRTAREEFGPKIENILAEIQRINTRVIAMGNTLQTTASVVQDDAEAKFTRELDKLVVNADGQPDWQPINNSTDGTPGSFLDWVNQIGDDSDEPRLTVLQRAYQRKDAKKCAGFFNAYKAAKGLPTGNAAAPAPAPTQTPPVDVAAGLVSPSPVAPSTPSANRGSGSKKVWKLADIEAIYSDFTKGKYKGEAKMAEYRRLTADIEQATLEGRVST